MMTEIEATTEITQRNFFQLQLAHMNRRISVWMFVAFFAVGITCLRAYFRGSSDSADLVMGIWFVLAPAIFLLIYYWVARKQKRETVVFQHPITYRISEQALSIESRHGINVIPWADMYDHMEDKHSFYLYISSIQCYILPKKCFTAEQAGQIQELIKNSVPVKRKKEFRIFMIVLSVLMLVLSLGSFFW